MFNTLWDGWGKGHRFRGRRVWFIPLMWVLVALILGYFIPRTDIQLHIGVEAISPSSATAILSSIASGTMSLTAIVFSITFLFVQFGSSAYSPRIVTMLTTDTVLLHAFGIFSGTFLFALIALISVDRYQTGYVPLFTTFIAMAWLLGSIIMFLALMQRITNLQITRVLQFIGDRARLVIQELYPPLDTTRAGAAQGIAERVRKNTLQERPAPSQVLTYTGGPRVLVELNPNALAQLARRYNALLVLEYAVGDYVADNSHVLCVYGASQEIPPAKLRAHIALGPERTIEQDPKYALRLLVDIAIKALSPAINDPTTAVQSLDQIDDLLRRIGTRALDVGYLGDGDGKLFLIYPTPSWDDLLSLAIDEIRMYGATSIQVMRRLGAMLDDLEQLVPQERRAAVRVHAQRVETLIRRTFHDQYDRLDALQVDRQGLGMTRSPEEETP